MFKKFKKIKYNSGMTLIELLVVLAIFAIISGITMFDYASFKSSASLNNLANDIALSIRKAQSYAIGARGNNSGSFSNGYKVHFSTEDDKSFNVISDNNDEIEKLDIKSGDFISGFTKNGEDTQISDLYIGFIRPNPDAKFYNNNDSSSEIFASQVGIILSNQKEDKHKIIRVTTTGQISIENYAEQN